MTDYSPTFVFFHVGPDVSFPAMLVRSLRLFHPNATIVHCSDDKTPAIPGVTRRSESAGDTDHLMTWRLSGFAKASVQEPALYLDTDMLLRRPVDPAMLLGQKTALFCRREFDVRLPFKGNFRGVRFGEIPPKPIGIVYPYLACATITRDYHLWESLSATLATLPERYFMWYGDQEAMKIMVNRLPRETLGELPESLYACLPERSTYVAAASILHFKGAQRKSAMQSFYREMFPTDAEPALSLSNGSPA